ncbi:MAG: Molybdenum cofactor biosynthesis protein MoaB [Candidatus Ozemobacter sibiricus]|uniref:Molybdenum cofactor biosynthesis protein B n=1 Tax=Candidatus Ozemobacter sibiricus TaxID=2268124 RepID=A0A367ZTX5_9BACT|nr:MAG: Molybdenum cofactor biosynthesis protein MoaB [Candidatus Ozemobacter sibiricus]
MSHHEHEAEAPRHLRIGILTLSDTRDAATDRSGSLLQDLFRQAGHEIVRYAVIREDPATIEATLRTWLSEPLDVIVTNGGTGLTSRDGTIEVARRLMQKELEGFGELFRLVSYHQIGPAAMLSRATAGLAAGRILICLPGSTKAVRLAATRLILPQVGHMVREARR